MVERLCAMADLPKPKVAIMDTPVPNAFATGRSPKHAAVCVTTGLWNRLEPKEIEGVLAHELSHIAQPRRADHDRGELLRDARRAADAASGSTPACCGGDRRDNNGPPIWLIVFAVSIVTYALSYVLIRTISRYREYAADRGSALITGAPEYLMSALQKISSQMTLIPNQDLRQVEGMSAFFIIPAKAKLVGRRALRIPPAAREAPRRARRDRAGDGPPGRVDGFEVPLRSGSLGSPRWHANRDAPLGLSDALFGRKKLAEPKDDRLFALTTAAVTLDVELGLKTAGVAALAFKPQSSGEFEARSTTSTS